MWLGARYEDEYVKLNGEWKFFALARDRKDVGAVRKGLGEVIVILN